MDSQPQTIGNTLDPNQAALMQRKFILNSRARNGTDWFFWIAGLSLINSIIYLTGNSISFVAGLGITKLIDLILIDLTSNMNNNSAFIIRLIGFCIDLFIAGIFVLAGILARKQYRWIIIAGMVLYALDMLVFLLFKNWFDLFFHGFALWGLWNGLQAINALKKLEESA